jgi:hypothetical protein
VFYCYCIGKIVEYDYVAERIGRLRHHAGKEHRGKCEGEPQLAWLPKFGR